MSMAKLLRRIDASLIACIQHGHIGPFTRLLYRIRAPHLTWRLSDRPRRVDASVTLQEGVKRARVRCYYRGSEGA